MKSRLGEKAPATVNNVLSVLNTLLRVAVERGILEEMPCRVRLVKVPKTHAHFHDFDD